MRSKVRAFLPYVLVALVSIFVLMLPVAGSLITESNNFLPYIVYRSNTPSIPPPATSTSSPTPTSTLSPTNTPSPTSTPSPTNTQIPQPGNHYFDDFSDPNSGWPTPDNTHISNDCYRWYYDNGTYNAEICDDRTDIVVCPGVSLPDIDYEIEVRSRFDAGMGFWTSYGIIFDSTMQADEFILVWVLFEPGDRHKWKILKDTAGDQISLSDWTVLDPEVYDYSNSGTAFNTWNIIRTENQISVYVNDNYILTVTDSRLPSITHNLFGLYSATYETGTISNPFRSSFDYYQFDALEGTTSISSSQSHQVGATSFCPVSLTFNAPLLRANEE